MKKTRIVVLDGYTSNPGDLDWSLIQKLGDCKIHLRTEPGKIVQRAAGAEIVLTNKVVLDRATIEQLPELKYVGVLATGYNIVDVEAAREHGIRVTNIPVYSTDSVAQLAFALLLELAHRIGHHSDKVRRGGWNRCTDFCFWDFPLIEIAGLRMGVVGFGRIGRRTAKIAKAFKMKVSAYDISPPAKIPGGITFEKNLDDIFRKCDVVSLHCPLVPGMAKVVDARRLGMMKESAFLINTARGALVDEHALADALNSGKIAGAGIDVLSCEPPDRRNPLLSAKNCIITPHIAWATFAARKRLMKTAADNIRSFLNGRTRNCVNI